MMLFVSMLALEAQEMIPGNGTPGISGYHINRWGLELGGTFSMTFDLSSEFEDVYDGDLKYYLVFESPLSVPLKEPVGITIDQKRKVTWTPTTIGTYYFGVKAVLASDTTQFRIIGNTVDVRGAEAKKCAYISGNIKMPAKNPKYKVTTIVVAEKIAADSFLNKSFYGDMSDDSYMLKVPAGRYKLSIQLDGVLYYYPIGSSYATAKIYNVECGSQNTIQDFEITEDQLPERVYFTSSYIPKNYKVGDTLIYDANAESSKNAAVRYRLNNLKGSPGTIDSISGLVKLPFLKPGYHAIQVEARSMDNEKHVAYETISLVVTGEPMKTPCAKIKGSLGLPENIKALGINNIQEISVYAIKYDFPNDTADYSDGFIGQVSNDGSYSIDVPEGKYLALFNVQRLGYYAPSAFWAKDARIYEVTCGQDVVADFDFSPNSLEDAVIVTKVDPNGVKLNFGDTVKFDVDAYSVKGYPVFYAINKNASSRNSFKDASINNDGTFKGVASAYGSKQIIIDCFSVHNGDTSYVNSVAYECYVGGAQVGENCSVFRGQIIDENKKPIFDAKVYLVSTYDESDYTKYMRSVSSDSNGAYTISLPEGDYYVYVKKAGYEQAYLEGEGAISVACGDTLKSDFVLKLKKEIKYYTVSGKVTEDAYKMGLSDAKVYFMTFNDAADGNGRDVDLSFVTTTDSKGAYTIKLPEGQKYIAAAEKYSYLMEYYDGAQLIDSAKTIDVSADINNINFNLMNSVSTTKHILGRVADSSGKGINSIITAIRIPGENDNQNDYSFETSLTDPATGFFDLWLRRDGDYILFILPVNKPYMPGFLASDGSCTANWESALRIHIANGQVSPTIYKIILKPYVANVGNGIIKGSIATNGGTKIGLLGGQNNGVGLKGVFVSAYDAYGRPVKSVYSDENGAFSFGSLSYGKYTISASKVSYASEQKVVYLEKDNNGDDVNILLTPKNDNSSSVENNEILDKIAVYPNPASSLVNLTFFAEGNSTCTISVSDINGSEVIKTNFNSSFGTNKTDLDVSSLPNGVYLVRITSASKVKMTIINVVK
jgi:hypothetical protein